MEIKRPGKIKEKKLIFGYETGSTGRQSCIGFKADYPDKASFEKQFLSEVESKIESDEVIDDYAICSGIYAEVESLEQLEDMQENYLWSYVKIEEGGTYWTECPDDYICEAYEYPVWIVTFRTKAKEDE